MTHAILHWHGHSLNSNIHNYNNNILSCVQLIRDQVVAIDFSFVSLLQSFDYNSDDSLIRLV